MNSQSNVEFLQDGEKTEKPFPLQKLPYLANVLVIESMDLESRFQLPFASEKTSLMTKKAKKPIVRAIIEVKNEEILLQFINDDANLIVRNDKERVEQFRTNHESLYHQYGTVLQQAAIYFEYACKVCSFDSVKIKIRDENVGTEELSEFLAHPTFKDWTSMNIDGVNLEAEEFCLILNQADSNRSIFLMNSQIPVNFKHPNAFNFKDFEYDDARWVTLDDLLNIRNVEYVAFGVTNFNDNDMKTFVNHLVKSDEDLFEWMRVGYTSLLPVDQLFKGLVMLECPSRHGTHHFTLAKPTSINRKRTLLSFLSNSYQITVSALLPTEGNSENMRYRIAGNILNLLEEKGRLEKKVTKNYSVEDEHALRIVTNELNKLNVTINNGKAIVEWQD